MRSLLMAPSDCGSRVIHERVTRPHIDVMFDAPRVNVAADPAGWRAADAPVQIVEFWTSNAHSAGVRTHDSGGSRNIRARSASHRDFPLNAIHLARSARRSIALRGGQARSRLSPTGFHNRSRSTRKR
jgi:hypothetical protein